ncbi:hypothetical protein [Breoghania sp.]|uniref:hypothetical protein n=1 Tax=Breoghania sp. TaxID=2065378 RepID=UPI002639515C|nr:hypothetical protein [Breoghania sp.]MDJ0933196.1 hypothetical protein [Breoghania sp.]
MGPGSEGEEIAVFNPATVPLQWLEKNATSRKAVILDMRLDVEAFCYAQQQQNYCLGINDIVFFNREMPLSSNEKAAIRVVLNESYEELDDLLGERGSLARWSEEFPRLYDISEQVKMPFHILRYRSKIAPNLFKMITVGNFLFEDDLDIQTTALVVDCSTDQKGINECCDFEDVFFLNSDESPIELMGLIRNATGRNPMITDAVTFSVDYVSQTLVRLQLA